MVNDMISAGLEFDLDNEASEGLDQALLVMRKALGPIDCYHATYARTGLKGKTAIFGKKLPGANGSPIFVLVRKNKNFFLKTLGFGASVSGEKKKIGIVAKRLAASGDYPADGLFMLGDIASNPAAFERGMTALGKAIGTQHPAIFEKRINGQSRNPANYSSDLDVEEQDDRLEGDLEQILEQREIGDTTRETLILARVGQGDFRREVLKRWGGRCAVTGCDAGELIRASHVQPWSHADATYVSRLDPDNGIPLVASLDAMFDAGLMTFDDEGLALFADQELGERLGEMGVVPKSIKLRNAPGKALKRYLAIHRAEVFRGTEQ